MTLTSQIRLAIAEAAPTVGGCRVCKRRGLPILLLREALVPKPHTSHRQPKPEIPDLQLGWRTLRAGYLYVLLDDKVWQGYQVSQDGYLRQFNPFEPPCANEKPLARACVSADHDMPAALINIDTDTYRTASLAFTSDPWPKSVLDAYQSLRHIHRMHVIDLVTARDAPDVLGDFLTPDEPKVFDEVYEYQAFVPGFDSVHGFHSRAHRRKALRNFLRTTSPCASLGPGLLALVIEDPVGLVQEYNAHRAQWAHARQMWLEEPERAYQRMTSQILLTIKALHRPWAESKVASFEPMSGDGPPTFVDPAVERQRILDRKITEADERLEERYDEPKRRAFQTDYDRQLAVFQAKIDQYAVLYAAAFFSDEFQCAMQHDYDGDDRSSGIAYSKTMALCLQGGISEAPGNDSGPTVLMWQKLLQEPNGPVYQALLMRDKHLLAGLLPSLSAASVVDDWNDSSKLYTLLTKTMASDEASQLMRPHLQESIAQLLAALNAATTRLKQVVNPSVELAVSRLNTASQLLYNGIHLVEFKLQMKLVEYYILQAELTHKLQSKLANGMDRIADGTRKKIQPLIMNGLPSLSAFDPRVASLAVTVSVWMEGSPEDLKRQLSIHGDTSSVPRELSSGQPLTPLVVGLGTLDPTAGKVLQDIKVPASQAKEWVRSGLSGLKGVTKSGDLLMAIGSYYLMNESMKKNLAAVEEVVGDKSLEVILAFQGSSLAMLGGGLEVIGTLLQKGSNGISTNGASVSNGLAGVKPLIKPGSFIVRTGAVISALSGMFDAAQAGFAASRSYNAADRLSAFNYGASAAASALGAGFAMYATTLGVTAILSSLGAAILFGLAGYFLFKLAEREESSRLEQWSRRCYFGKADEIPKLHWDSSIHSPTAMAELNSVILGLDANVTMHFRLRNSGSQDLSGFGPLSIPEMDASLKYKIVFPNYDENRSAYHWSLISTSSSNSSSINLTNDILIAEGETHTSLLIKNTLGIKKFSTLTLEPETLDKFIENSSCKESIYTITLQDGSYIKTLEIRGEISLKPDYKRYLPHEPLIILNYWPDHSMPNGYAELIKNKASR
jgi:hypothetical protein